MLTLPPRLTDEEVEALVIRLKNGDLTARDPLIESHTKLAAALAAKFAETYADYADDLLSVALKSLVENVDGAALTRDNNIGAYLNYKIVRSLLDFIKDEGLCNSTAHVGTPAWKLFEKRLKEQRQRALEEYQESLPKQTNSIESLLADELINGDFSPTEKRFLRLKLEGYSDKEVADLLGVSQSRISIVKNSETFRKKVENYL